jgi:polyhydroxyalkanoate synthesis regulator phasin
MGVMTTLAVISQALEAVKKLRGIEKDFDIATYKLQVADLASSLAEAKKGLVDVKDEIAAKDAEIERLKKATEFQGTLVEHRGFQYDRDRLKEQMGGLEKQLEGLENEERGLLGTHTTLMAVYQKSGAPRYKHRASQALDAAGASKSKRASIQEKLDELRKELQDLEKKHSLSADEPSVKTQHKIDRLVRDHALEKKGEGRGYDRRPSSLRELPGDAAPPPSSKVSTSATLFCGREKEGVPNGEVLREPPSTGD